MVPVNKFPIVNFKSQQVAVNKNIVL